MAWDNFAYDSINERPEIWLDRTELALDLRRPIIQHFLPNQIVARIVQMLSQILISFPATRRIVRSAKKVQLDSVKSQNDKTGWRAPQKGFNFQIERRIGRDYFHLSQRLSGQRGRRAQG